MNGSTALVTEYLIVIAMVTGDEIKNKKRMPLPRRYLLASTSYAILGVAAAFIGSEVAAAFGAGLLLALLYNTYRTSGSPNGNTGEGPGSGESNQQTG